MSPNESRLSRPAALAIAYLVLAAARPFQNEARDNTPPVPSSAPAVAAAARSVHVVVDAGQILGKVQPFWRYFGADEPNYAYADNGQTLLAELGSLAPGQVYFRTHNLLNSGDGTSALKWGSTGVYRQDAAGQPVYRWDILDRIFDTYRDSHVLPYVEIGMMPEALSLHPEPYQHHWNPALGYNEIFTGWAYPPKDYRKWADLVYEWTRHCLERYGSEAVEKWDWEVWNEPNIGYWRGSPEEFLKLHDYAVDAVRRALPTARVGGPDVAGSGGSFTTRFLEHCLHGTNFATGVPGTPLDFVSFHAKGAPVYRDGHVRMGIANQLRTVQDGFRIISQFPELKGRPVVIGECDPEGCAACQGPSLAYRNGTLYASYTAASFARIGELAQSAQINLTGALTWAFEFENQPIFAGFRSLATRGIDKPVLNVFRMFSKMSGWQIAADSDATVPLQTMLESGVRDQPDVSALASLDQRTLCVLVWHYHDDDLPGPDAQVQLELRGLPLRAGRVRLRHFRVDEDHSNAYTAWKAMGSPPQPTPLQLNQLIAAGQLATLPGSEFVPVTDGKLKLEFTLPLQGVSLLEWNY